MNTVIAVMTGLFTQMLAIHYFDGNRFDGFVGYLLGFIVGWMLVESNKRRTQSEN